MGSAEELQVLQTICKTTAFCLDKALLQTLHEHVNTIARVRGSLAKGRDCQLVGCNFHNHRVLLLFARQCNNEVLMPKKCGIFLLSSFGVLSPKTCGSTAIGSHTTHVAQNQR